jgi:hypothetical protein
MYQAMKPYKSSEIWSLTGRFVLQVEASMELLEVCLRTTYFQVDDKDGMDVGRSLSPIVSNVFKEHFDKLALDSGEHKPLLWLRLWSGLMAST